MFRNTRVIHRWVGILTSLFMVVIASTGLLLSLKKRVDWIQPPSMKGAEIAAMAEVAPLGLIAESVIRVGIPELATKEDFDRFELHVDKNLFKVTSKSGYHEVQVDAKTGKVLSVARRNDQFIEQLHDMSFFSPLMRDWVLPVAGFGLLTLGLSGIFIFFVPVVRRWKYFHGLKNPPKAKV